MEILFKSNSKLFIIQNNKLVIKKIEDINQLDNVPYILDQPIIYNADLKGKHINGRFDVYYELKDEALCYQRKIKGYYIINKSKLIVDYTQVNINKILDEDII